MKIKFSTFDKIKHFLFSFGRPLAFKIKINRYKYCFHHSRKQKVLPADCREAAEPETEADSPRPEVKVAPSSEHFEKPKANGYTR